MSSDEQMSSDEILRQYHAAMARYYEHLDADNANADDVLALANALHVRYDRALQDEFDAVVTMRDAVREH